MLPNEFIQRGEIEKVAILLDDVDVVQKLVGGGEVELISKLISFHGIDFSMNHNILLFEL